MCRRNHRVRFLPSPPPLLQLQLLLLLPISYSIVAAVRSIEPSSARRRPNFYGSISTAHATERTDWTANVGHSYDLGHVGGR